MPAHRFARQFRSPGPDGVGNGLVLVLHDRKALRAMAEREGAGDMHAGKNMRGQRIQPLREQCVLAGLGNGDMKAMVGIDTDRMGFDHLIQCRQRVIDLRQRRRRAPCGCEISRLAF